MLKESIPFGLSACTSSRALSCFLPKTPFHRRTCAVEVLPLLKASPAEWQKPSDIISMEFNLYFRFSIFCMSYAWILLMVW